MAKAEAKPIVADTPRGKGSNTVTVACKFPAGVVLQLCRKVEFVEEGIGGVRINRVRYDKEGRTFVVRGPAEPNGQTPKGYRRPVTEGGYALTHNIPADFWEKWLAQNQGNPLVENGMIFAAPDRDDAEAMARENAHLRSGFEPIVPDTDPRIPKSINAGVGGIETAKPGD